MSDTPPDQRAADDAQEGSRNPWVRWLMCVVLVPVLYLLGLGPANWLHEQGVGQKPIEVIYLPIELLPEGFKELLGRYCDLWRR